MPSDDTGVRPTAVPQSSSFALLCWLVALLWMIAATIGAVVFGLVAVTAAGRCAALALAAAGWGPFLLTKAWVDRAPRWCMAGLTSAALALVTVGVLAARAPDGAAPPSSRVQCHLTPGQGFSRLTPGNLVPEVDQLMVAYTVAAFDDPMFTSRQARELKVLTRQLYAELEADPDFMRLPSALPCVYRDILGGATEPGPVFVYVPPGVDRAKPVPVLVFFHTAAAATSKPTSGSWRRWPTVAGWWWWHRATAWAIGGCPRRSGPSMRRWPRSGSGCAWRMTTFTSSGFPTAVWP